MVDTSQPDRRAGRQRQERQERRAEVTNASDTDPTTNTNTLEGNPILPMEPAEFFTREEWLTELLEVFHENLEPLQMNHDVEGIRQLIDWLAENLGADDELAQASPRTLPSEDRAAAHQNAATTRLANRLSRAFRRLDRLEARVPEGDEPLNRMVETTRGGADPYGPPSYGPPSYGPPSYGPPSYGPPSYGPPSYGPPSYGPPSYGPPSYGPPQHHPLLYSPHPYNIPQQISIGPPQSIHSFLPNATRQRRVSQPGPHPPRIPPPSPIPNEVPRGIPIYEFDLATNELREIQSYDGRGPTRDGTDRRATNRRATNRRATNRRATNGATTNGVTTNRATTNRAITNGVTTNGVTTNGVTTNGVQGATDEHDEIDIWT